MDREELYITAVFCKEGAGGNKAGVALGMADLPKKEKQAIAARLALSETVFVGPSEQADYKLEYFTPVSEVPLCGHATVAAFTTLWSLGRQKAGTCTIETGAGVLRISLFPDGRVFMEQRPPAYGSVVEKGDFAGCMDTSRFHKSLPIQIVSTGLPDVILPMESPDAVAELTPDLEKLAEVNNAQGALGVHAFAFTEGEVDCLCRNYSPACGIPEDPATGTASCALACYLFAHGFRKEEYLFEQIWSGGTPSRLFLRLETEEGTIRSVWVGGTGSKPRRIFERE